MGLMPQVHNLDFTMEKLGHDALDAGRMVAAAFLGWTVTGSHLDLFFKFSIACVTLIYMVGKASLVWYHFMKERSGEKVINNQDD